MWYQSFFFTQLLIIAAVILAFFAFIFQRAEKRWETFVAISLIFILLSATSIFFEVKYRQKVARFKIINYQFQSIKDLSDFDGDKYSANVVTEQGLTPQKLKEIALRATKQLRSEKKDATIIWLSIFDKDDPAFNQPDKQNPNFIAQTQWKRQNYVGLLPQSFVSNDSYKDVEIYFNRVNEK